eukprot:364779-Chlamydomonas_euryale.AAC.10
MARAVPVAPPAGAALWRPNEKSSCRQPNRVEHVSRRSQLWTTLTWVRRSRFLIDKRVRLADTAWRLGKLAASERRALRLFASTVLRGAGRPAIAQHTLAWLEPGRRLP